METAEQAISGKEEHFLKLIQAVGESPRDVDLLIRAGNAAFDLDRKPEAFLYLSRALELDPAQKHILPRMRAAAAPEDRATVERLGRRPATFADSLKDLFHYPFRGMGFGMLLLGAILFYFTRIVAMLNFFPAVGIFVGILLFGYLSMWFMDICKCTAAWDDDIPHWPDPTMWVDLLMDWTKIASAKIAAFLPVIGMVAYLIASQSAGFWADIGTPDVAGRWGTGFLLFVGIYLLVFMLTGLVYMPMALMANSIFGSMLPAWNPVFIVRSIFRVPKQYFLCLAVFAGTWVLAAAAEILVSASEIYLFAGIAVTFIELYVMVVLMRMLGLLYRMSQGRLAWFN